MIISEIWAAILILKILKLYSKKYLCLKKSTYYANDEKQ